jgi:hypothetical protein
MPLVGPFNSDLCFFGLARTRRRDNFVHGSGHGGTWLFLNSRSIQTEYSCGLGHTRLRHFLLDAGTCGVASFFLTFLIQHPPILTPEMEAMLFHFAQLRNMRLIPVGNITFGQFPASAFGAAYQ